MHIDKYVIAEVDPQKNDAGGLYYDLTADWKSELQSDGWLPHDLPAYQIGIETYLPVLGIGLFTMVALLFYAINLLPDFEEF